MSKRALISVSDKSGLNDFAAGLVALGYTIVATGGSAAHLSEAGIAVTPVDSLTGFQDLLGGRVKTLHPNVFAPILARNGNEDDNKDLETLGQSPFDIVVVNLYPFEQTIGDSKTTLDKAVENIDIGGVALLRAAAKNWDRVFAVSNPNEYTAVLTTLESGEGTHEMRRQLATEAFRHTSHYDAVIAGYLAGESLEFPAQITIQAEKAQDLRYGENPHQGAAFYRLPDSHGLSLANAEQLGGKELSFNNIADASAAVALTIDLEGHSSCVALKHANPCGAAWGINAADAYQKAFDCDPVSIFGGIVAFNSTVDKDAAMLMSETFLEVLLAPSYTTEALEILQRKKNLRILRLPSLAEPSPQRENLVRSVLGGLLVQNADIELSGTWQVVTKKEPTPAERDELDFAWRIVKHVKSNGIVLAREHAAVGVGQGQPNRIWSTKMAIERAGDRSCGSVMASDAFFPFDDCVHTAAAAGITAIIQPGGSIRDHDSIRACDEAGIAMVFTGVRHFEH